MSDSERLLSRKEALLVGGVSALVLLCGAGEMAIHGSELNTSLDLYDGIFRTRDVKCRMQVKTGQHDLTLVRSLTTLVRADRQILADYSGICSAANAIQTSYAELCINPNAIGQDYSKPAVDVQEFSNAFAELATGVVNGQLQPEDLDKLMLPKHEPQLREAAYTFQQAKVSQMKKDDLFSVWYRNKQFDVTSHFGMSDRVYKTGVGWQEREDLQRLQALILRVSKCMTMGVGFIGQTIIEAGSERAISTLEGTGRIVRGINLVTREFCKDLLAGTENFLGREVEG